MAAQIDIVITQIISNDEETDGQIAFHTPGELAALGCVAQVPVVDDGFALMHFTGLSPDTRAQEVQRLEQEGRFNYWASRLLCEPDTDYLSANFSTQPDVVLDDAYLEIARERWAVTRVPALGGPPRPCAAAGDSRLGGRAGTAPYVLLQGVLVGCRSGCGRAFTCRASPEARARSDRQGDRFHRRCPLTMSIPEIRRSHKQQQRRYRALGRGDSDREPDHLHRDPRDS